MLRRDPENNLRIRCALVTALLGAFLYGLSLYNEGMTDSGPFRLSRYPRAARALRQALGSARYPAFAPDW